MHIPHLFNGFSALRPSRTSSAGWTARLLLWCGLAFAPAAAQNGGDAPSAPGDELVEVDDSFSREADFIDHLLTEGLFDYANLAVAELRARFPGRKDRVSVVEAGVQLRQGRTEPVEKILGERDLKTDEKAQAILLRLAMTYDVLGRNEKAMERYQTFLDLNEGKEITDPDVLRYFASAGMRLARILQTKERYADAAPVLQLVVETADSDVLKRKFTIMAAQNRLDQALAASGSARDTALKQADTLTEEILWGGNDNYWFMAMAIRAWVDHLQGQTEEAVKSLRDIREKAAELEERMDEAEVPKSEYPMASIRLVEGLIQWDAAKQAMDRDNEQTAKRRASQAAGNLYTAFLNYEGSEYADRAALEFEELNAWVEERFDTSLIPKNPDPRLTERIFRRQLDLAEQLLAAGEVDKAERRILDALERFPVTPYTLQALNTLGKIWIERGEVWELMALAQYVTLMFPDNGDAAGLMLRIGRGMVDEDNVYGAETVLGAFGREYPSHPSAPAMLYRIGKAAAERGETGRALEFYDQILEIYPRSKHALTVLRFRGDEAMKAGNHAEAIKAYGRVRDQAQPGLQRALARLKIADARLATDDPELGELALEELTALREELQPRPESPYYAGDNAERTPELLESVQYRLGQLLLRKAGEDGTEETRGLASKELNSFLEAYPESKRAPTVMYNLGRLYLQRGRFDRATSMFEDLAQRYPESEEGRDALYALVKAALEEDLPEVARDAVRKMVARPQSYGIGKIYRVGKLMLDNQLWPEAMDGFRLVLDSPGISDNTAMRQRALLGMGDAALGAGDLERAAGALDTLIADYANSSLVMDAGITLADVYLDMDPPQFDKARAALGEVARILKSRPDKVGKAKLDMAVARVALAEGHEGKALSSWYKVALTRPDSQELGDIVRRAILRAVDLSVEQAEAGETKRWSFVVELTEQYRKNFPMDAEAERMNSLNVRAIGLAPRP